MMRQKIMLLIIAWAMILGLLTALPVRAEDPRSYPSAGPVPWVSYLSGKPDRLFVKHGSGDWFSATVNTPLGEGTALWQDEGARSEVFLDRDTFLRLDELTAVSFLELREGWFVLALDQGRLYLRSGGGDRVQVNAGALRLTVLPHARVRVENDPYTGIEVNVWRGEVEVDGPAGFTALRTGQCLRMAGGADYQISMNAAADAFDRWNEELDEGLLSARQGPSTVVHYLPPRVSWEMEQHGYWYNDVSLGWVWVPRVVEIDWAPYRVGRWCYWEPWGWTWVSYEPWGWYPYHYGRWTRISLGWVWCPFQITLSWHPGLVFWFEGPGWIGWEPIPLGISIGYYDYAPVHVHHHHVDITRVTVVNINHFYDGDYHHHRRPVRDDDVRDVKIDVGPHHHFTQPIDKTRVTTPRGPREPVMHKTPPKVVVHERPNHEPRPERNQGMTPVRRPERPEAIQAHRPERTRPGTMSTYHERPTGSAEDRPTGSAYGRPARIPERGDYTNHIQRSTPRGYPSAGDRERYTPGEPTARPEREIRQPQPPVYKQERPLPGAERQNLERGQEPQMYTPTPSRPQGVEMRKEYRPDYNRQETRPVEGRPAAAPARNYESPRENKSDSSFSAGSHGITIFSPGGSERIPDHRPAASPAEGRSPAPREHREHRREK